MTPIEHEINDGTGYEYDGNYKYDGRKLWLNDQPVSGHGHLFYWN